ncbi:MAG: succinate dehydrogenase assembly factor 2 [Alphaproteobacteria bacterium]|nr:succinate dehydrogenase assembly factor 2 [Alphaproteobacteria bacterium]
MENLSIYRKRLLYQSQHRGMREMDLLLGEFGKNALSMDRTDLEAFEFLLSFPDQTLYALFFNNGPVPSGASETLVNKLQNFKKTL